MNGTPDLAAGLTHELNQPLCAIVNYAEACLGLLADGSAPATTLVDIVERIRHQAERAGDVMRRLRAVIGRVPVAVARCDLEQLVADTIALMQGAIGRAGATVTLDAGRDRPFVLAEPLLVQQVTASLIRCGLDAATALDGSRRGIAVVMTTHDGLATVAVSDARPTDGVGDCERLFDPLSCDGGRAEGLSLAVCRAIVESLGGRMWATVRGAGGMTVSYSLPRTEPGVST